VTAAKASRPEATARPWSAGRVPGSERATAAENAVGETGSPASRRPLREASGVVALAVGRRGVSANGWWAAAVESACDLGVARAGQGSRRSGIYHLETSRPIAGLAGLDTTTSPNSNDTELSNKIPRAASSLVPSACRYPTNPSTTPAMACGPAGVASPLWPRLLLPGPAPCRSFPNKVLTTIPITLFACFV
jgi:hypothetical protein